MTLVQEIEEPKQRGFLIYAPVYYNGAKVDTVAERRAALEGFVYAAFRTGNLFPTILAAHEYRGIDFQVFDGTKPEAADLLYDSAPPANGVDGACCLDCRPGRAPPDVPALP